jgi:hypothetical protein
MLAVCYIACLFHLFKMSHYYLHILFLGCFFAFLLNHHLVIVAIIIIIIITIVIIIIIFIIIFIILVHIPIVVGIITELLNHLIFPFL